MPDIKSLPRNVFIFLTGIATQLFTSTNIVPSTSIEIPVQLAIASASRFAKKTANVVSKCFHDRNTVPFILVGKKTLKVHWSAIENEESLYNILLRWIKPRFFAKTRPFTLILTGMSGVGKSTVINGFINSLLWDSLKCVHDNKATLEVIKKVRQDGLSDDKDVTIYKIIFPGGHYMQLVDTPGFNDTDGNKIDEDHIKKIIASISHIRRVDAIICCVNAGSCRKFEYATAINILISHLDKRIAPNFVYFATKALGSNYDLREVTDLLNNQLVEWKLENILSIPTRQIYTIDYTAYATFPDTKWKDLKSYEENVKLQNCISTWEITKNSLKQFFGDLRYIEPYDYDDSITTTKAMEYASIMVEIVNNLEVEKRAKTGHPCRTMVVSSGLAGALYTSGVVLGAIPLVLGTLLCYNTISTRRTTFKELTEIANAAACFTGFLHHRLLRSEENDKFVEAIYCLKNRVTRAVWEENIFQRCFYYSCEWLVDEINEMLETYNEEKALAINEHQNLSPERAKRIMEDLFKLNTFGKYIKETHDKEMNKLYSDEIYLPRLVEITLVTD